MVKYTRIILYPQAVLDSQFPWGFQARTTNSKFSPLAILKTRSRANSLVATTCDKKNRTINLSIKAKDSEDEKAAIDDYNRSAAPATTTLGDILKEKMEEGNDQ